MINYTLENYGDENCVACPECGFGYNHIEKVTVFGNHDNGSMEEYIEITGGKTLGLNATRVKGSSDECPATRGRGLETLIEMSCENGHIWKIELSFHKGNSSLKSWYHGDAKPYIQTEAV